MDTVCQRANVLDDQGARTKMPSKRSYGLVLVGENLPIRSLDPDDFEFPTGKPTVVFSVPVGVQLQAGPYMVLATQERYQVTVETPEAPDDDVAATLVRNAESLLEYAGKRSVTAVGHNIECTLPEVRSAGLWAQLVHIEAIGEGLGLSGSRDGEVSFQVPPGDASHARIRILCPPTGDVHVNLNYHFDIASNPKMSRPLNAVTRLRASMALAADLTTRLIRLGEGVPR